MLHVVPFMPHAEVVFAEPQPDDIPPAPAALEPAVPEVPDIPALLEPPMALDPADIPPPPFARPA